MFGLRQMLQKQLSCLHQYLLSRSVFRKVLVGSEHGVWLCMGI